MASGPITSWEMGKQWKQVSHLILGGSKITVYGDCSHEIKICLLLGRKVMTNLDSIFKSRDITLPKKVHLVRATEKAMAPHSSTLAWKISWVEKPGQSMGSLRVRHDWATSLSLFTVLHWRRKWQPTPLQCSCLENPRDGGTWWAAVSGVAQSRTRLKWLSSGSSSQSYGFSSGHIWM